MRVNRRVLSDFEELMLDWDQELNDGINPAELTRGSHKYINWRCHKCGRVWKAPVNSRVNGTGCICDANKRKTKKLRERLIARDGSLAQTRPDIAAQWHPSFNGDITPNDITEKSMYKAWWLGEDGIAWQSVVSVRCRKTGGTKRPQGLVIEGVNDLKTLRPDLAEQWDFEKNQNVNIDSVMPGSKRKVWWICDKGHEWIASVASRNDGRGCPTCNQERSTSFPEQATFYYIKKIFSDALNRYYPIENMEVDVFIPSYKIAVEYDGSYYHASEHRRKIDTKKNKKLFSLGITLIRIIEEGGEPPEDTEYTINCPRVNNVSIIEDALKDLFPLLGKLTGKTIELDINVERDRAAIYEQFIISEKQNSIALVAPEIVSEWHPTKNGRINPEYVYAMSNKVFWWKCQKCGYEWKAPAYRRSKGNGCPVCSGNIVMPGINDLATVRPDLVVEWDYDKNSDMNPRNYSAGSNKKVWWRCKTCSFEWEAVISNRTRGRGCPKCSGKVVSTSKSIATLFPNLVSEWVTELNTPHQPEDFLPGSEKQIWWRCKNGHLWQASIANRTKGNNCPYCGNKKVLSGFNDLASIHPELMAEWDYDKNTFSPESILAGSNKKVWWKCKNNHYYQAAISKRIKGTGCPYCDGKRVAIGYNDLNTVDPNLAKEWNYEKNKNLLPTQVTKGSNKRVWWKCTHCSGEWEAIIWSRAKGRGCPYCAGVKPRIGINDLATLRPDLLDDWDYKRNTGNVPQEYMPGSRAKVWWKCKKCSYEWEATISSRSRGGGCPRCTGRAWHKSSEINH